MFSEDLDEVAGPCVSAGDVHHGLIHADVSYHRAPLAAHPHFAAVVREPPVKAIGVPNRDDPYRAVFVQLRIPALTDGLTGFDGLDGEDGGLERAYVP